MFKSVDSRLVALGFVTSGEVFNRNSCELKIHFDFTLPTIRLGDHVLILPVEKLTQETIEAIQEDLKK